MGLCHMIGLGTIINSAAIVAGGVIGLGKESTGGKYASGSRICHAIRLSSVGVLRWRSEFRLCAQPAKQLSIMFRMVLHGRSRLEYNEQISEMEIRGVCLS